MGEAKEPNPRQENVYAALMHQGKRIEIRISSHAVCLASPVWEKALSFPRLPGDGGGQDNVDEDSAASTEEAKNNPEAEPKKQPSDHADFHLDEFELLGHGIGSTGLFSSFRGEETNSTTKEAPQVLDLTEDDAYSALILLRIAHLQFHKVSRKLEYGALLKVALLCDYYDCISLVQPWGNWWLQDGVSESRKPGQHGWLTIAWVFDKDYIFNELAKKLVLELSTKDLKSYYTTGGHDFELALPFGIAEDIKFARNEVIRTLLDVPYSCVDKYVRAIATGSMTCVYGREQKYCNAIHYGSLLTSLQSHMLWPRMASMNVKWSVNLLISKLKSVETLGYNDHVECGIGCYKEEITAIADRIEGPMLSSYRRQTRIGR